MEHSYFRDKVSAYFDNELSPQEKKVVEEHLAQCQECRTLLAELKGLGQVVEKHSQLAGEDYWEQAAQKIEQRLGFMDEAKVVDVRPSKWRGLVPKLAAVAASVAILGFIALYEKEIFREVGLEDAYMITPPSPISTEPETSGVFEKKLPTYDKESTAPKELGKPPQIVQEAVKRQKKAQPLAEDVRETTQRMESREDVAPDQEDQVSAVDATILKGKGVTSDQAGQVAAKPAEVVTDLVHKGTETVLVEKQPPRIEADKESANLAKRDPSMQATLYSKREETTDVEVDKLAHAVEMAPVAVVDTVVADDLMRWRQRRDSLQTLYAELSSPHLALSEAKSRRKETAVSRVEEVEWQLLYSYYQIARLTQDQAERTSALAFLRSYIEKPQSFHKDRVEQMLQELEQE